MLNFVCILGYSALYTITPESYITEIRNIGTGFANICARIAAICCPIVTGIILEQEYGFEIAVLLYAGLFMICGAVGFLLKETRNANAKALLEGESNF